MLRKRVAFQPKTGSLAATNVVDHEALNYYLEELKHFVVGREHDHTREQMLMRDQIPSEVLHVLIPLAIPNVGSLKSQAPVIQ